MKHVYTAICGALLVFGLAVIVSEPAVAGSRYDAACNCMRPDSEYHTRKVVRGRPIVRTHRRYVDHTRVVKGKTKLIQENRLVVHVRPVINKEVVVHRQHTVVKDVVLHRTNTTNKYRTEHRRQVVNRYVPGSTRRVVEHRRVRGVDCNCEDSRYGGGYQSRRYYGGGRYGGGRVVSYRN